MVTVSYSFREKAAGGSDSDAVISRECLNLYDFHNLREQTFKRLKRLHFRRALRIGWWTDLGPGARTLRACTAVTLIYLPVAKGEYSPFYPARGWRYKLPTFICSYHSALLVR